MTVLREEPRLRYAGTRVYKYINVYIHIFILGTPSEHNMATKKIQDGEVRALT